MRNAFATAVALCAASFGIGMVATPALAQPHQKTLIIYGDEPCPTSNGEEIVVCNRLPANDRYRIPKELRTTEAPAGVNGSPASRVASMDEVSSPQTGLDTCSPVGGGGQTGCFRQAARSNKAARRAAAAQDSMPDK